MPAGERMKSVVTVRLAKERVFFGPGVVAILKGVEQNGSIKGACRDCGLSYSKAWKILNIAEAELGYPLVRRLHGGKSGGGCEVTEEGVELLIKYEQIETKVKDYTEELIKVMFADNET